MAVYNSIQLDLCKKNSYKAIPTKQLDINSRFLRVELLNNSSQYDFNDDVTVILASTKNGETKAYKCTVEDGCVVAPLTSWMLAEEGYVDCEIVLIDTASNSKLSSFAFSICVDESIYNDETITQDENYSVLLQLITDVDTAVKSCNTAAEKATEIYNTVETKLNNGELKGDKGDKGDDGAPGKVQDVLVNSKSVLDGSTANINVGITQNTVASISAYDLKLGWEVYRSLTEIHYSGVEKVYCDPGCLVYSDTYPRFILVAGQFRYSRDGKKYRCGGWLDGEFFSYPTVNDMLTELANYYSKSEVDTELAKKQGTLTAGTGVTITDNNVISAVAKLSIAILGEEPSQEIIKDYDDGVLYLYSPRQTPDDNIYDEYIIVERDLSIPDYGYWEKIGTTEVDLSDYAKKTDLPTATSQLTNDSNFVSDENYIHTDNNFTTAEKNKLSGLSNYDDTAVKALIATKQDSLTATQINNINAVPNKQDKLSNEQLTNIANVSNKQDKLSDEQLSKLNSDLATKAYVDTSVSTKQDSLTTDQLANISAVTNKQDKLTSTQLSNISAVPNKQDKLTTEQLNNISAVTGKQDKLTDTQLANIEAVTSKQDKLTSAQLANIEAVTSKQDKLTAGANLKIENNIISLDIETATAETLYGGSE